MRARRPARGARPRWDSISAFSIIVTLASLALPGTMAVGAHASTACPFTVTLAESPDGGATPLLVRFNATVSSGVPSNFDWAFGDGSYWNASISGGATPLHRYSTSGTFSASVGVTEGSCTAQGTGTLVVTPGPIVVTIFATPTSGKVPLTVSFNASATGGTGTYLGAVWQFGDGGAGTGVALEYTYVHGGTFRAQVKMTDSGGGSGVGSANITAGSAALAAAPAGGAGAWAAVVIAAGGLILGGVYWRTRPGRGSGVRRTVPTDPPAGALINPTPPAADPTDAPAAFGDLTTGPRPPSAPAVSAQRVAPLRGGPSPANGSSAPVRERRQLSQRVLMHIGSQGFLGSDEVAPVGLSQAGMAQALHVSQNSLTNVLRRFVAAGILSQDVRHVRGQPRRLRVYRLTGRGEALYQDVRRKRPGAEAMGMGGTTPPTEELSADPGRR